MAFYLVRARLRPELAAELLSRLQQGEIGRMQPFGPTLAQSLRSARRDEGSGEAVWEEQCFCRPPLAQERTMVLDRYFLSIRTQPVEPGDGWRQIAGLPALWEPG